MQSKMRTPAKRKRQTPASRRNVAPRRAATKTSAADVLRRFTAPSESIGFFIREVYRGFARSLQVRIAREGVSIGMWFVLRILWEEDGLTQRQISERVGINGPTVVTAINNMERAGFVNRVNNRTDQRKTNVFLTKRGHRLKGKLWPMAREVYAVAFKNIAHKDIAKVGRVLTQVWVNLESERRGKPNLREFA